MAESKTRRHLPHIVIDGRELVGRPTGVGRYLMGLMTAWASRPLPVRITVLVPGDVPDELRALAPPFTIAKLPKGKNGTLFEQFVLPGAARRLNADVFFAPAYTGPLALRCPMVLAVYDLSYFAHPEWFSAREGVRRRWVTRRAARRAARVITISEFSAKELHRYLGLPAHQIVLAPPGAPEDTIARGQRSSARQPLILYAGSIFARRGVPALIDAFAGVVKQRPDARLVLVGDDRATPPVNPTALAEAAGIGANVDWRRYVPDAELQLLYAQARAFAFLSEYEGFAMTPMEAIAHGVPVVLRDTEVAREVYGNGAALVGHDRAALTATLLELLTDDQAHDTLLCAGRARLAAYSWSHSADLVMQALVDAAAAGA